MEYIKKISIKEAQISLFTLFGVENTHLNYLSNQFPNSKITYRGDDIFIQGEHGAIIKINEVLKKMITHCRKFGTLTQKEIEEYLSGKGNYNKSIENEKNIILYTSQSEPIFLKTKKQGELFHSIETNDITFAIGPAGTGKTFIAVASALKALKNKQVKKIIITRPIVETGEHLGFLPGDVKEKINPYLRPIYDVLYQILSKEKVTYYLERDIIEIVPLAYMRGRTLTNCFVLLDEGQNTLKLQIKMFLTRIGLHSKVVVTGDLTQIDLLKKENSGLKQAIKILKNIPNIGIIHLDEADIQRHPLVREIIKAYQEDLKPKKEPRIM